MTLADYIKAYRKSHGISQRQFAVICGLSNGYISMTERGINPKTNKPLTHSIPTLQKFADGMGVSLTELFSSVDDESVGIPRVRDGGAVISNIFPVSRRSYPLLGNVPCGEPVYASEDHSTYIQSDYPIDADFCLKARGDSMIGARIYDGDIVFVKRVEMVNDGEIAVVLIGEEATLKRVRYDKDAGDLWLFPENPNYRPMYYSGSELNEIKILGRAVAFQAML